MNVADWFNNNGSYDEGVMIYAKHKHHNRNLLRLLLKKESAANFNKLKYELSKFTNTENTVKPNKTTNGGRSKDASQLAQLPTNLSPITAEQDSSAKYYRFLRINDLPVELHPLYMKQKEEFMRACSLKIQLNALHPAEESKALELCIEIERLFDSIEKSWKIFDHYRDFGVVLHLEEKDYNSYSAAELVKAEATKMSTISKLKTRIKKYQAQIPQLEGNLHQQKKAERALLKSTNRLLAHEVDLQKIKEQISK